MAPFARRNLTVSSALAPPAQITSDRRWRKQLYCHRHWNMLPEVSVSSQARTVTARGGPMRSNAFVLLIAIGSIMPASADIIYSGIQDIVIQSGTQTIELAGVDASWDTISLVTGADGGGITIFPGAEVALASSATDFPDVTRFNFGDPFPSDPIYGSGGKIIYGPPPHPGDGDFYSAMLFGTFGGGPMYSGWIQLDVQNTGSPAASITVVDWAYSNVVGQTISMGEVPEPLSLACALFLMLSVLVGSAWRRTIARRASARSSERPCS